MKKQLSVFVLLLFIFFIFSNTAKANVHVYGPGGPAPIIKEIIQQTNYTQDTIIQFGPLENWKDGAQKNADIIFSGSEYMMNSFGKIFSLDPQSIIPLAMRRSGILVRSGNPKKIQQLTDLAKSNVKIAVVDGAGQISLWEDIVGKAMSLTLFQNIRKNIVLFAANTGALKKAWEENPAIDVVIIWEPWQRRFVNSTFISLAEKYTIYRPALLALTKKGSKNPIAVKLYKELISQKTTPIWQKHLWLIQ